MIVGMVVSAISGGVTGSVVSLMHGNGLLHAVLSYPLGGVLAIMSFVTWSVARRNA